MNEQTEPQSEAPPTNNGDHDDHRSNGKIARLPKNIRDQVNAPIRDGVSYPDIRSRFHPRKPCSGATARASGADWPDLLPTGWAAL